MPMKSSLLAIGFWLATVCAATAQTSGVTVVTAEQVEQIRAGARAAQASTAPAMSRPIIEAAPYTLSLEHRTGKAPASLHTGEAEVIIVLDGAGTITTGGTLVDAVPATNGNVSGKDITGGTPQHLTKGDMLLVPQGTAHMMVPDAAAPFVLATLHLPRTGEPAPVAGRMPSAPKLIHHAADLPAMIEKAKAAAASSPRFFGGDTILSLAPYRIGLEYRTPKGIASVHKTEGEFMLVLEGEGVIVAGGTVVNPKDLGANIDGDAVAGGIDHHMKTGDWIFVPKGEAHLARTDGTFVLATLHVP
jgi:mannose-6-phosphate isomerase-like protein (cupin superfamily)